MKKYKFDYIKEMVDQWCDEVPKDAEAIKFTPFLITPPFIGLDENCKLIGNPPYDHYGEVIDDMQDWLEQRDKYCEELAEEYKKKKISN